MDTFDAKEAALAIEENESFLLAAQSPGFKAFLAKAELMKSQYSDISKIKSIEEFHMNKGRLDILTWILSWPALAEQAVEDQKAYLDFLKLNPR
jgi:hypothetical protein